MGSIGRLSYYYSLLSVVEAMRIRMSVRRRHFPSEMRRQRFSEPAHSWLPKSGNEAEAKEMKVGAELGAWSQTKEAKPLPAP